MQTMEGDTPQLIYNDILVELFMLKNSLHPLLDQILIVKLFPIVIVVRVVVCSSLLPFPSLVFLCFNGTVSSSL